MPLFSRLSKRRWYRLLLPLGLASVALLLIGLTYTPGVPRELPIAVVDGDQTALSRQSMRMLDASSTLSVEYLLSAESEVAPLMRSGKISAAVVFPEGMQQTLRRGGEVQWLLVRDASVMIASRMIFKEVSSVSAMMEAGLRERVSLSQGNSTLQASFDAAPLRLDVHYIGNRSWDYRAFLLFGLIPTLLQISLLFVIAVRRPTLRETLLLFLLHLSLLLFAQGVLLPALGSTAVAWGTLFATSFLFLLSALFLGVAIGRAFDGFSIQAAQFAALYGTSSFVFSGWTFPLEAMPRIVQPLLELFPLTLALKNLRLGQVGAESWKTLALLASVTLFAFLFIWLFPLLLKSIKSKIAQWRGVDPSAPPDQKSIWLDPALLLLLAVAPLIYPALYGALYSQKTLREIPVIVTDEDQSAESRALVRTLASIPGWQVKLETDPLQAKRSVVQEEAYGWFAIPRGLSESVARRQPIAARFFLEGRRFYAAGEAGRWISSAVQEWNAERIPPGFPSLRLRDQTVGDRFDSYGNYLTFPLVFIIFHQLLLAAVGLFAVKRSLGETLRLSWPLVFWSYGFHALAWPLARFFTPLALSFFPPWWLLPYIALVWLTAALLFRLLSARVHTLFIVALSSFPLVFLSGMAWPLAAMNRPLYALGELLPLRHAVSALLREARLGASGGELFLPLFHLALLALFVGTLAVARLLREKRKRQKEV